MGEAIDLILAIATLIGAIGGVVIGIRNSRHIHKVEKATNGLSKALGQSKFDQGTAEGYSLGLVAGQKDERENPTRHED